MFSYWLRNRSWISILLALALAVLMGTVFIRLQILAEAGNRTKTSVYTDSEISYDIPSPIKEQLEQIAQEDFVDEVFGYYYAETKLTFNGKPVQTAILFSDYMNNVGFTMYSEKRCIKISSKTLANPIYIDYDYARKNGVGIEDKLYFQDIEFDVQAIYETNTYYGSAILVPLVGEQKTLIDAYGASYSGAYVKVNDITKAQAYWQTYKPYGRLKSPEDFNTIEAYDYHYSEWSSTNYLSEITYFPDKAQNIKLETYPNQYIWSILFVILGLAFDIILSFRKSERKFFKKKEYAKDVLQYYVYTSICEIIVGCITLFVTSILIKNFSSLYVSDLLMRQIYVQIGITLAVFAVFNIGWGLLSSRIKK